MSNIINIQKPKTIFSSRHRKLTKKQKTIFSIVLAVVVLIIGASVGVYYYLQIINEKTPTEKITEISSKVDAGGDKKAAQAELKELAAKEKDIIVKTSYLLASYEIYYNSYDFANAIKIAQEIEELNHSANSASVLGDGYLGSKDYANAAKYYGIAADRSEKTTNPNERMPYNDYMAAKKRAEELNK